MGDGPDYLDDYTSYRQLHMPDLHHKSAAHCHLENGYYPGVHIDHPLHQGDGGVTRVMSLAPYEHTNPPMTYCKASAYSGARGNPAYNQPLSRASKGDDDDHHWQPRYRWEDIEIHQYIRNNGDLPHGLDTTQPSSPDLIDKPVPQDPPITVLTEIPSNIEFADTTTLLVAHRNPLDADGGQLHYASSVAQLYDKSSTSASRESPTTAGPSTELMPFSVDAIASMTTNSGSNNKVQKEGPHISHNAESSREVAEHADIGNGSGCNDKGMAGTNIILSSDSNDIEINPNSGRISNANHELLETAFNAT